MLSFKQRIFKVGRFVGRGGRHLKLLERTLNININIFNEKSSKHLRDIIDPLKIPYGENQKNFLWVLFTMKNNNSIEEIKQSLQDEWKNIDVLKKQGQSGKIRSHASLIQKSTDISGDTRWKPKKQRQKDKHQRKQKESLEENDVPPQPLAKPISMPKQITRSRKTK
jgi:hypothetical protein